MKHFVILYLENAEKLVKFRLNGKTAFPIVIKLERQEVFNAYIFSLVLHIEPIVPKNLCHIPSFSFEKKSFHL